MSSTIKRILAFCAAIVICLSTLAIGAGAVLTEDEQKFWSVFNYNNVYKNMGLETFKAHWNKARDQMPLLVYFGTQRVGYANNYVIQGLTEPIPYLLNGDVYITYNGTYQTRKYIGHGNGFIYAGDTMDVPSNYCYMGHLWQFMNAKVTTSNASGIAKQDVVVTVHFLLNKGALSGYDFTMFDEHNNLVGLGNLIGDYECLTREYSFTIVKNTLDIVSDITQSPLYYKTRFGGTSSTVELTDGDFYGFMFGQTPGSIYNERQNGSPESIFYAWFEGPFGIDEDTDGMEGQRFGMISPLFYQEGYDAFYDPIYNEGYDNGYDAGYTLGDLHGYHDGYDKGLKDGFAGADTSTAWMNMKNLIFSIFDAPFYVISYSLDFDLFGINIAGTLIALISTALIVWILKIILVKLF